MLHSIWNLSCLSLCQRVLIGGTGIGVKGISSGHVVILVVFWTGIWIWSSFRLPAFNCCSSNSALCSYQQWWVKQQWWIFNGLMDLEWSNWICVLHSFLPCCYSTYTCKYSKCAFYNVPAPFNYMYMQTLLNQWFCVSWLSIILADLSGNFTRFKRSHEWIVTGWFWSISFQVLLPVHVHVVVIMTDYNRKYGPYFFLNLIVSSKGAVNCWEFVNFNAIQLYMYLQCAKRKLIKCTCSFI